MGLWLVFALMFIETYECMYEDTAEQIPLQSIEKSISNIVILQGLHETANGLPISPKEPLRETALKTNPHDLSYDLRGSAVRNIFHCLFSESSTS